MTLIDMVKDYQELLEKKESLAEETKNNNAKIEALKQEIAQQMIDEDTPEMAIGDYIFSLRDKTEYSKKSEKALQEASLNFLTVLREQGLGDIIVEQVNARTLNSTIKNLVAEEGELPEELEAVLSRFDTYDVVRRKKKNKALNKAKGVGKNV